MVLPTSSCLTAAKIMARLSVGQVGGSLRHLWRPEGPVREERPLPWKDWELDSGDFLARMGAFAERVDDNMEALGRGGRNSLQHTHL